MKSIAFALIFVTSWVFDGPPLDPTAVDDVCLSNQEFKLYHLIMDYRKNHKLEPIPVSAKLSRVARTHTQDLMANYAFSADNSCNPHSWSAKGSWTPCCYTADHKAAQCMWSKPKEIAEYTSAGYEIAYYSSDGASAQEGLQGWKLSPGHNTMIINQGIWSKVTWKAIGISIQGNYGIVWFGETEDPSILIECN